MPIAFKQYVCDNLSWQPIAAPVQCNSMVIPAINTAGVPTANLKVRVHNNVATEEFLILAGNELPLGQGTLPMTQGWRFPKDEVACYVQTASGTSIITVRFE